MPRYLLTDAAKSDIRRIIDYWRPRSPQAAKPVRHDLKATFQKLAQFPYTGHRREEVSREDLRFWSVYSDLVVHRPDPKPHPKPLEIRVLHGAQDIPKVFKT